MKILNTQDYIKEKYQIKPLTKERLKEVEIHTVIATDDNIKQLVKDAIEEYGNKANLNFIDTSQVTDMNRVFYYSKFNGDISKWDVSNVITMKYMFYGSEFNGDISQWNVSNVVNMECMLAYSKFNGDISKWDVSNVKNMSCMFVASPLHHNPPKWYKK